MKKVNSILFVLATLFAAFLLISIYFVQDQYEFFNPYDPNPLTSLEGDWYFTSDSGDFCYSELPVKLNFGTDTSSITMTNTLPDNIDSGAVIYFFSECQAVEIYIDDELRASFGSTDVSIFDYVYINSQHLTILPLYAFDAGAEIRIELSALSLYTLELQIINEVRIGVHSVVIFEAFFENIVPITATFLGFITFIFLVSIYIIGLYRGKHWYLPLITAFIILLWTIFATNSNFFYTCLSGYSATYSMMSDAIFFVLDGLLPILTYAILYLSCEAVFNRLVNRYICFHCLVYLSAIILHGLNIFPFNIFRPILMLISFIAYTYIFISIRRYKGTKRRNYIFTAVFLMSGYYFDYIKFMLAVLPFESDFIVQLNFDTTYMHFINYGIIAVCILTLVSTTYLFAYKLSSSAHDVRVSNLQADMLQSKYEQMKTAEADMARFRHDMLHHFRSVSYLYNNGENEKANEYLEELASDITAPINMNYSKNDVLNVTLSWFSNQAKLQGTEFKCESSLDVPSLACDKELCSIVSNILQNAIDATRDIPTSYIKIKIKRQGNYIFITSENNFDGFTHKKNGKLLTRKTGDGHGYGLETIERLAKDSGGMCEYHAKKRVFSIKVVIGNVVDAE